MLSQSPIIISGFRSSDYADYTENADLKATFMYIDGGQLYYVTSKIVVHLSTVLSFPCVVSLSIFVQFLYCAFPLKQLLFSFVQEGGGRREEGDGNWLRNIFLAIVFLYMYILHCHFNIKVSLDSPSGRAKCLSRAYSIFLFYSRQSVSALNYFLRSDFPFFFLKCSTFATLQEVPHYSFISEQYR